MATVKRPRKLTAEKAARINRGRDLVEGTEYDLELPRERVVAGRGVTEPRLPSAPDEYPILFSAPMIRALRAGKKTMTRRIVPRSLKVCDKCWDEAVPHNLGPSSPRPQPTGDFRADALTTLQAEVGADMARALFGFCYLRVGACDHPGGTGYCGGRLGPRWQPGDHLWVRETWGLLGVPGLWPTKQLQRRLKEAAGSVRYAADDPKPAPEHWRPSIFLYRPFSRITLKVDSVRIERLHAITEEDARAEGVDGDAPLPARINGKPGTVHCFGPDASRKAFAFLWNAIHGRKHPWASDPWVSVTTFSVLPATARPKPVW